jgi:CheY-like chemotaxis protein
MVLLLEDDDHDAELVRRILPGDHGIVHVRTLRDALIALARQTFSIIIADLNVPDARGKAVIEALRASAGPDVEIVPWTGQPTPEVDQAVNKWHHGELRDRVVEATPRTTHMTATEIALVDVLRDGQAQLRAEVHAMGVGLQATLADATSSFQTTLRYMLVAVVALAVVGVLVSAAVAGVISNFRAGPGGIELGTQPMEQRP